MKEGSLSSTCAEPVEEGLCVGASVEGEVVEGALGTVVDGALVTGGSCPLFFALFVETVTAMITTSAATRSIALTIAARFALVFLIL